MNNETNIEEDIKIARAYVKDFYEREKYCIGFREDLLKQAIENILADREEWKNNAEWFKRLCNKNEETIMDIDVNNLKQKQYEFLKNNTIRILNEITRLLQNGNLQAVTSALKFSGAGDGYGQDNWYINFSYDKQPRDLQEIIEKMAELKGIELQEIE